MFVKSEDVFCRICESMKSNCRIYFADVTNKIKPKLILMSEKYLVDVICCQNQIKMCYWLVK